MLCVLVSSPMVLCRVAVRVCFCVGCVVVVFVRVYFTVLCFACCVLFCVSLWRSPRVVVLFYAGWCVALCCSMCWLRYDVLFYVCFVLVSVFYVFICCIVVCVVCVWLVCDYMLMVRRVWFVMSLSC